MIGAGHGVAESVQPSRGVGVELPGVGEEYPARPHRGAHEPGADDPGPYRRRRVVPAAGGHRDARGQTYLGGHTLAQGARALGPLVDTGHPLVGDLQGVQDLAGPLALPHVEEKGAGGVGGVGGVLAGQPQPDVVLGQEHAGHPPEVLGLLVAQPDYFWRLEAGQGGVAGDRDQTLLADGPRYPVALGPRALVVPQEGGPDHLIGRIQKDRAVHLAG